MTSHDSGDGDDDAQLKSLRAVWLSLPDEDPPERGLAELMAAARVKAEQMAKPSLWQRLAALLRRPPVLALATVLVLIGGAVFIGQRKSNMEVNPEVADQRARENTPATGSAASGSAAMGPANTIAAPEAPAGAAELAPADDLSAEPAKPPASASPEPKKDEAPKSEAPPRVTHRPSASNAGIKAPTTKTATTKMNDSVMEKSAPSTDKKESQKTESRGFDDTNGLIEGDLGEKNERFSPPPPAAPTEAPAADVRVGGGTKGAATTQAQPEVRRAQQYIAQAKTAAARGDCAAARTLMKRVASEDAASYRKAIASDAALKKCFD